MALAECIHELIAGHGRQTPDRVALVCGDAAISYGELDRRANRLAAYLRARGVTLETRVGIYLERSIETVVAMVGILKAGGAYVGLDRRYPRERLAQLFRDAALPVVITQESLIALLPEFADAVLIDRDAAAIARESDRSPDLAISVDNAAQAIYTSGSSGRPKGVLVSHRTVLGFGRGVEYLEHSEGHTYLQYSSISWDATTLELWFCLTGGGRCVLYPGHVPTLAELADLVERHQVTTLFMTSTMFNLMVDTHAEVLRGVRRLYTGSETVSAEHVRRATAALPDTRVFNGYGPAECGTLASVYECSYDATARTVPIGRPVGHQRVYILDARRRRAPIGATGELYVAGEGVGRGYLNQPALTAERFVPDPFAKVPGARMYRTGDMGRHRADGVMEFLGRGDSQVKVRGYRVELGEIEGALREREDIREAAVLARDGGAGKALIAYVVGRDTNVDTAAVRAWLRARLPDYMVPGVVMALPAFPVNAHGKLDRAALPAPPAESSGGQAPRTPVEELIASVLADALGRERISVADNFFDLGGHSLLALQVVARLREVLRVTLPLRWIFEAPTVAELAACITAEGAEAPAVAPIERVSRDGVLPLSWAQQRLWVLEQLQPGEAVYNVPLAACWRGGLDVKALEASLSALVARHELLRTRFVATADGRGGQVIEAPWHVSVTVEDWGDRTGADAQAALVARQSAEASAPFDLTTARLLRAQVIRLTDDESVLLLTLHHLVCDGWSLSVLVREVEELYAAAVRGETAVLPQLPVQYADYAAWQHEAAQTEALDTQLAYWRTQLSGAPALALPTAGPRPAMEVMDGGSESVRLDAGLVARVRAACRREGVTPHMLLMAAWSVVLGRWSQQDDLVIGTPVAGRTRRDIEGLIGFFVNTLPIRLQLAPGASARELLRHVREACLAAYAHQDVPFERLVDALGVARDASRPPLVQVLLNVQQDPVPTSAAIEPLAPLADLPAKFELALYAAMAPDGLTLQLEYRRALFSPAWVRRIVEEVATVIETLTEVPDTPVAALPWVTDADAAAIRQWSTGPDLEVEGHAIAWIAARAAERPDAVAVAFEDTALTYAELDARAATLAHALRAAGVGPEVRVGVCLERSLEIVVSMLAIWKAGGAYVPLDPSYPPARLSALIGDAALAHVLVQRRFRDKLGDDVACTCVDDPPPAAASPELRAAPDVHVDPDNSCYTIYTSGSTGKPKGAVNRHHGLSNRLRWIQQGYPLGTDDVVLQKTPISFDVSVWEFLWPLVTGAKLVLARPGGHRDPEYLADLFDREQITIVQFVPSMLDTYLLHGRAGAGGALRRVICSGEALTPQLVTRAAERWDATVINLFGPTEASIEVTVWECPPDAAVVPIGRPIANARMYVLDAAQRLVPANVIGELFIAGAPVARGYLNQPALTAERFIPDFYSPEPGARMYRTGDVGRYRAADGAIEFLGRRDSQIKVRGFRIELGEIESVLREHPSVREAVVTARDGAGGTQLAAYVAARDDAAAGVLAPADVRTWLRARLPEYMVPGAVVMMPALPLSAHGKVDRQALPLPQAESAGGEGPRTAAEELVASVMADVLGRDSVSATDNFFDLGGHSLLALQAAARLRDVLRTALPLRWIFETPVVAELAAQIEAAGVTQVAAPIVRAARDGVLPLSWAQQRLWVLEQLQPGQAIHNVPIAVRWRGALDVTALEASLSALVARHEVLRTCFVAAADGKGGQVIEAPWPVPVDAEDWRGLPSSDQQAALVARQTAEAAQPFDLATSRLMRARAIRLADDETVLLLTLHHLVCDGWSLAVLVRELERFYAAAARGEEAVLPALPVQYADYAAWQHDTARIADLDAQLAYWQTALAGAPALALPTNGPRPAVEVTDGGTVSMPCDAATTARVRAACRREGVTLHMLLLAAWAVVLGRWSQQHDLVIGTPIAGRPRREVEGLIGFFVNTLPIRLRLTEAMRAPELLRHVREACLAAYGHQDVPFERLVDALDIPRDASRPPLVQALINVQQNPLPSSSTLEPIAPPAELPSKFELALHAADAADGLTLQVEYRRALFTPTWARRILDEVAVTLDALASAPASAIAGQTGIGALPWVTDADTAALRQWSRGPDQAVEGTVTDWIAARAAERPDAVAIVWGDTAITYSEVDARTTVFAAALREAGIGPEVRVGVCLERSIALVLGLIAIWKAGGAYVPLDPSQPSARLRQMADDGRVSVVITESRLEERLKGSGVPVLHVDGGSFTARGPASEVPDVAGTFGTARTSGASATPVAPHDPATLAYVMFTSGSTGTPKGVEIAHDGVANLVAAQVKAFGITARDRVLQYASIGFDASVSEIFTTLAGGATLELIDGEPPVAADLAAVLHERAITAITLPPSVLRGLSRADVPALATVISAGEACSADIARAWGPLPRAINAYGPTEATVCATLASGWPSDQAPPPIGRPIANVTTYVLEAGRTRLPAGVLGELCVGGRGVARGYSGKPSLTAERFVPDPFSGVPGARMYRTGDLARYLADGALDYAGRADTQVKVHGHRIELGEIEAVLRDHRGVRDVAVTVHRASHGSSRLVAYVVGRDESCDGAALRTFLRDRLPDYMMPAAFVALDALPLTPHGKIDRASLPAPEAGEANAADREPPRTATEVLLAGLWAAALGREGIGIHQNFFELGGDSILSLQVASRARQQSLHVTARAIFEHPTVAELAAALDRGAHAMADVTSGTAPASGSVDAPLVDTKSASVAMADLPPALLDEYARRGGEIEDVYPASPLQAGMLFHTLDDPRSGLYATQCVWVCDGELEPDALWQAWEDVVARHAVLRTAFAWEGLRAPVQIVHRQVPVAREMLDWQELSADDQKARVDAYLAADRARGWRLAEAPLWRLALARTAPHQWHMIWSQHHMLLDGWSLPLVVDELLKCYAARRHGEASASLEQAPSYRDYIAWLARQDSAAAEAHWRGMLGDWHTVTPVPGARHARQGARQHVERRLTLDAAVTRRLEAWARRQKVTLSTIVQGAWALVLSRYASVREVGYGLTIAGRPEDVPGSERMVGLLINTVPMRVAVPPRAKVGAWLRELQAQQAAAQQYGYMPLAQLQAWSGVPAGQPLFDTLIAFENYPRGAVEAQDADLAATLAHVVDRTNYPLTFVAAPGETLELKLGIDIAAVDETIGGELLDRVMHIFRTMADDTADVADLDATFDRPVILSIEPEPIEWTGGLPEAIEAASARQPDAVAIVYEGETVTYGVLAAAVAALAHQLHAAGVGPETRVGLCLERSVELVVAIVAVLHAGAAYVPLDPELPQQRLAGMAADGQLAHVLTSAALRERVAPLDIPCSVVMPRELACAIGAAGTARVRIEPEHACYVLYTSGSTGKPKGVVNQHGGLHNRIDWMQDAYRLGPDDVVLQKTPFSFDVSVWEFLWPLRMGARLVVARPDGHRDATYLGELLDREQVTTLHFVPSMLEAYLAHGPAAAGRTVRQVICSGEALPGPLAARCRTHWPQAPVHNLYGPTEASIDVTAWTCQDADAHGVVPIGVPIARTQVHVLDAERQHVPTGAIGEVYLAGAGLARGYLGRPDLTADRFVPDPYGAPGARLYRTGDLGRRRADGVLEYVGRVDSQVKVRGYRIELGEIEAALRSSEAVRDAALVVRDGAAGQRQLVAYVVSREGALDRHALRRYLRERLPVYMLPSFVEMDALPLTAHGKVDRKALPAPAWEAAAEEAPRTATEAALAAVWVEVLGRPAVGSTDNFFELGGDSILSLQVVSRARKRGLHVTARQIFDNPTVAELAAVVDATPADASREPVSGDVALTPIQRWFFDQRFTAAHHFNQAMLLRLRSGVTVESVRAALDAIVMHHDALRMRYEITSAGWRQVNLADDSPAWWQEAEVATAADVEAVAATAQAGLDLVSGPVHRAVYVRVREDGTARLLWAIHHLVVDGVSWRVLLEDLAAGCAQFARSGRITLPAKSASLQQWASALTAYGTSPTLRTAELPYWVEQTAAPSSAPHATPAGPNSVASAARVAVSMSAAETQALMTQTTGALGASLQDLLLAAVAQAYGAWSGAPEVTLDLEGHGRAETLLGLDVARTVGWFTCLYPVRLPTRASSVNAGLAAVKRRMRAVPAQGLGYGLLRYVAKAPELTDGGAAICFNYLGQWDTAIDADAPFTFAEESTGPSSDPANRRTHVLEITAFVNAGRLQIACAFSTNLHRAAAIERFTQAIIAALRVLLDETQSAPESVAATAAAAGAPAPTAPAGGGANRDGSRVGRRNLEVLKRQLTTSRS